MNHAIRMKTFESSFVEWLLVAGLLLFAAGALAAPDPAETADKRGDEAGTTIIGEKESAIGLYITPWQEEAPNDMDRPPRLLDESLEPIDGRSFQSQVESYDTISAYRRAQLQRRRR
jgi:hypothetical protein